MNPPGQWSKETIWLFYIGDPKYFQLSSDQNPGYLLHIADTTQLYGDYDKLYYPFISGLCWSWRAFMSNLASNKGWAPTRYGIVMSYYMDPY